MLFLGLLVLWGFGVMEQYLKRDSTATFSITTESDSPSEEEIKDVLVDSGYEIFRWHIGYIQPEKHRRLHCSVRWRATALQESRPPWLEKFARKPEVIELQWDPQ
jgi:hypothetical protein